MTPLQCRDKLFAVAQSLLEKNGHLKGPASAIKASFMDACDAQKRSDGDALANLVENSIKFNGKRHFLPMVLLMAAWYCLTKRIGLMSGVVVKVGRQNSIHVTASPKSSLRSDALC